MNRKEYRKWEIDALRKSGFYVHSVPDDFKDRPPPLDELSNHHTHGFDETWGHLDFQIVLRLDPRTAHGLFWTLADRVKAGETFEAGKDYDEVAAAPYKVRMVEAQETGRKVLRVLIPDANNRLPGDEGVDPHYAIQTDV